MNKLEKAIFAVRLVDALLGIGNKILAIKLVRYLYAADLPTAKKFVDIIEGREA